MTFYYTFKPRRFGSPAQESREFNFRLPVNVREDDNTYSFNAVVPGLTADDLDIEVIEDVITIKGEYKSEDSTFLLHEIPAGKFERSLRMPTEMDPTRAEAEIKDGVLTVRVPKAEHALPHQIKVNVN